MQPAFPGNLPLKHVLLAEDATIIQDEPGPPSQGRDTKTPQADRVPAEQNRARSGAHPRRDRQAHKVEPRPWVPDPVVLTDVCANGRRESAAVLVASGLLEGEEIDPLDTG
jgi:hypothetical protein